MPAGPPLAWPPHSGPGWWAPRARTGRGGRPLPRGSLRGLARCRHLARCRGRIRRLGDAVRAEERVHGDELIAGEHDIGADQAEEREPPLLVRRWRFLWLLVDPDSTMSCANGHGMPPHPSDAYPCASSQLCLRTGAASTKAVSFMKTLTTNCYGWRSSVPDVSGCSFHGSAKGCGPAHRLVALGG